jgi:hypothetical protein
LTREPAEAESRQFSLIGAQETEMSVQVIAPMAGERSSALSAKRFAKLPKHAAPPVGTLIIELMGP